MTQQTFRKHIFLVSSEYYSNVTSDGMTDVSDNDDVLDMVKELDSLLDNLGNEIPEADDSFILKSS